MGGGLCVDLGERSEPEWLVTIRNQSSSDFAVDELVLVAGDVNRNPGVPKVIAEVQHMRATASFDPASPVTSSPGDYHAYHFPGQVTS